MRKIRLLLAVIMASFCLLRSSYAAEFNEPVFNIEFDTLVTGKPYYLYSTKTSKFIDVNSGVAMAGCHIDSISTSIDGIPFFTTRDVNVYSNTLIKRFNNESYNLYKYNNYVGTNTSSNYWYVKCVNKELKEYTISYYLDSCYIGFNAGDTLVHNLKSGDDNIIWKLLPYDNVSRYTALKSYYEVLISTSQFQHKYIQEYIDKYNEYSNNPNSVASDIRTTLADLRNILNKQKIIVENSNSFPLWISGDGSYTSIETGWNNTSVYATSSTNINICADFITDEESYLYLYPQINSISNLNRINIYDNGSLLNVIYSEQFDEVYSETIYGYSFRYPISVGTHNIRIEYIPNEGASCGCALGAIYVYKCPKISVNLLEPGSLGTEVLYYVDHLKDVTNLKIKGKINSDDWSKIDMMTGIKILDLSEADITEIPAEKFSSSYITKLVLPNTLKVIKERAFYKAKISELIIPESVENVGDYAFYDSWVKNIYMPKLKSVNSYTFYDCEGIEMAYFGDSLTNIGDYAFYRCSNLKEVCIGECIEEIGKASFNVCESLEVVNGGTCLPKSLKKIGDYGFSVCSKLNLRLNDGLTDIGSYALNATAIDSLFIPETATNIGGLSSDYCYTCKKSNGAYAGCANNMYNLVYIELPTRFSSTPYSGCTHDIKNFDNCPKVNTLVLKSPTKVSGSSREYLLNGSSKGKITLSVPDYLVNAYKLDEVWYNYNIKGFDTKEVKYWEINSNLSLYAKDRLKGNPNIKINAGLNILGEQGMDIDTLTVVNGSRFISGNDEVKINGELYLDYSTTKNKWYFISLPFNIRISDIIPGNNAKYAIRYYDGANRAVNGTGGNWENYSPTDTIMAGTGFIYQTSLDGITRFTPMDEESKQYIASDKMFVKELSENPSTRNSNKGWNFIGNPWQAYFNNHALNFTAPITVWNGSTYVAYSLIDDDYAIKPNEAFFVQCPEEINSISFPITGRQMTSVITSQSGSSARMFSDKMSNRQLIDIVISKDSLTDKTRVVVNENALEKYETDIDASKFFSMDSNVPQIYTFDSAETEYAINERPLRDGVVQLGFVAPEYGIYTISLHRNDARVVLLTDNETGVTTDLSMSEYEFRADQGTWNTRFTLKLKNSEETSIESVDSNIKQAVYAIDGGIVVEASDEHVTIFSVDGRKVAEQVVKGSAAIELSAGTYLVKTSKGTTKMSVR